MNKSRIAIIAATGFMAMAFAGSASAVSSEAECTANGGDVLDLKGAKHCLVPVIEEQYQSEEYEALQGVKECTGQVRKTSIGDYCLIALEPIPVVEEAAPVAESAEINDSIARDTAEDAAASVDAE